MSIPTESSFVHVMQEHCCKTCNNNHPLVIFDDGINCPVCEVKRGCINSMSPCDHGHAFVWHDANERCPVCKLIMERDDYKIILDKIKSYMKSFI
jgi:hypothetical protein